MDRLEPVDHRLLRDLVFGLRRRERRRVFPARLHLGHPAGPVIAHRVGDAPLDHGLRTDIVHTMLRRLPGEEPPYAAWLERVGQPDTHDLDTRWLPAVARACTEAGVEPRWLVVVTKNGWYAPRAGDRVTWKRLRIRS